MQISTLMLRDIIMTCKNTRNIRNLPATYCINMTALTANQRLSIIFTIYYHAVLRGKYSRCPFISKEIS